MCTAEQSKVKQSKGTKRSAHVESVEKMLQKMNESDYGGQKVLGAADLFVTE